MQDQENWLKQHRLARAWSQEQLAEISGLSTRTVQRIEQGASASLDTLKSLAAAFDMEVSTLQASTGKPVNAASSRQEPDMSHQQSRNKRVDRFKRQLAIYLLVNLGLIIINLSTSTSHLWFIYPLFFWGIAIVIRALKIYPQTQPRYPQTPG